MEPHSLRFVRCPNCQQLLVEYPSIPVYKCGGCGTVLRAKHRAVPAAQAGSESGERSTSSLKGSPSQSSGSICSGKQRADSSVDRPHEAMAHGSVSSTANDIDSCDGAVHERTMSAADSGVTHVKHPKEDTCSLTDDGNIQNSGVMVKEKEADGEDAGAGSSSDLTERAENVDAGEKANGGKIGDIGTSELSMTLYEKSQAAHKEERPRMYEGAHVESHKALIEELERSLSFSSDDEYFSDEAESSGLSDALRSQMGSRRFMLGGRVNDAPRSDPHGRLIEELEMSFSDAEEPLEQHGMGAGRGYGNVLNKDPEALGAKSGRPSEESLSSFDSGHLKSEQISHQESSTIGNGNQGNECIEDINNTADSVHGSDHIVIANDKIAERFHEKEHGKDCQPANTGRADAFGGSTSSVDDGSIEVQQSFQPNDPTADVNREMEDDKITNGNIVPADIREKEHGNGSLVLVPADSHEKKHVNDNLVLVPGDEDITERVCVNEELTAVGTQEMEDGCMEDDNMTNCVHGNDNSVFADENIAERVHKNEDLTTDGTQEMEEGCMEDSNMTNCVPISDNLVFADEDIAERVHGNKETADGAGENEEILMKNENENVNVAVADEDIAKKVHENEHGKDQRSLEDENAHLYEGVITSFSAGYVKSEQSFHQDESIPDATEEKEEDFMEDGNMANCIQENRAAVARFSSLPNKRNQSKLASFNKNKEQMTYRSKGSQLRQGRSLDSEDFHSIQKFMESQMDGTSSSLSSGSPSRGDLVHRTANKFNNSGRHERLRKMDELRDQLSRLSSQKSSERSYQKRGLEYQQQSNSYDVEHHLQSVDADSAPSSCALESYYGHGRLPRYPPTNPFSPTHCHFGHAQTRLPHNYDPWEFNSYYQSSYAESTILDHESLRLSYKEQKRVVRKHILRPLSGASPFTICNSCFNLVQMPSDVYISKAKVGKMQCGKCSKVLALSFPALYNANAKSSLDVAQESYNLDDSIVAKNDDIASYYAECLTGGPVSISEDYGASYTRNLPTQAGSSSLAATQRGKKVSDSALHRLMGYDSASQLLRHSRVFEDGYDSFESMVPVSSRVSRRKNT